MKNNGILSCDICRKVKKDVKRVLDPYRLEVFHEDIEMDLCTDCYTTRKDDV